MIELLIVAIVAIIALGAALVFVLHSAKEERLAAEGRQGLERIRWFAEREELFGQMKYLNDRYLAKHAGEVIGMERAIRDSERPQREHVPLIPEGL